MKEIKLTEKDLNILEIIKRGPMVPTDIGLMLRQPYNSASSYCSGSLKKLMAAGLVVKIKTDRVRYKLNQQAK